LIAITDAGLAPTALLVAASLALYAAIARRRFEREWRLLTGLLSRGG
ncbi:MAG: hypothetical protein HZB14_02850, partial [Actinobacteria bacterium]|nr:hypothetical protein [Actinomycetota bacterium]